MRLLLALLSGVRQHSVLALQAVVIHSVLVSHWERQVPVQHLLPKDTHFAIQTATKQLVLCCRRC